MIPYGRQSVGQAELDALEKVLKGTHLTTGPTLEAFEKKLADYVGSKYAVAVSNGTAALHLAVGALELPEGTIGLTSPNSFLATPNAMAYNGLVPKFIDINEESANISPEKIEEKSTDIRLAIPVHFGGNPAPMEMWNQWRNDQEKKLGEKVGLIEDAAHAIGARHADGSRVGSCSHSDMCIFSFHPVKTMTTGEGGAITTNDDALYEKLLMLRNHGMTRDPQRCQTLTDPWCYEMQSLGYNYRLTDLQAALGLVQLDRLDGFVERRREIISLYQNHLSDLNLKWPPLDHGGTYSAPHLLFLRIGFDEEHSRTALMDFLRSRGVGTQVHYIPIYLQPYYKENFPHQPSHFPHTEKYYSETISVPLFPEMSNEDVLHCSESLRQWLKQKG